MTTTRSPEPSNSPAPADVLERDGAAILAATRREMTEAAASLRPFFAPAGVAVIGASDREGTIGQALIQNLVRSGYAGPIFPVHPSATEIAGLRAFPSVTAIGAQVELAIVAVPAREVEKVIADCADSGVRAAVVISAGFAERSEEGRAAEARLRALVRRAGMRMIGPNCLGLVSTEAAHPMNASFAPDAPTPGNVAVLSQSGALALALLDSLGRLGVGISSFVSVGNKADVSGNDLLSYWLYDPGTEVIALYLESFGNPRRFGRIAPEVARKKPIVALKSGRSSAGKKAAASHSAAVASQDFAVDALFSRAGVIRAETVEELLDTVTLLSAQPLPKGRRVGIVTNSGGPAILLTDACEARGLKVPALSDAVITALGRRMPELATLRNPLDMIASAGPELYEEAVALVGSAPNVDAVVAIYTPPRVTNPEEIAAAIARGAERMPADKPVIAVFCVGAEVPAELSQGARGRIPAYRFPENAAVALAHAARYAAWKKEPPVPPFTFDAKVRAELRAQTALLLDRSSEPRWLTPAETARLLEVAGIPYAASKEVPLAEAPAAAAELGYPVVVKAVAEGLVHKTEIGGVILGLQNERDLEAALLGLRARARASGFELERVLVQREIKSEVEATVGIAPDANLGPILVMGSGGVDAEAIGDFAFDLAPSDAESTERALSKLAITRRIERRRSGPALDRVALRELVLKVGALADAVPEIVELDLNPVKVLAEGEGVVAVDARIRLRG